MCMYYTHECISLNYGNHHQIIQIYLISYGMQWLPKSVEFFSKVESHCFQTFIAYV